MPSTSWPCKDVVMCGCICLVCINIHNPGFKRAADEDWLSNEGHCDDRMKGEEAAFCFMAS